MSDRVHAVFQAVGLSSSEELSSMGAPIVIELVWGDDSGSGIFVSDSGQASLVLLDAETSPIGAGVGLNSPCELQLDMPPHYNVMSCSSVYIDAIHGYTRI